MWSVGSKQVDVYLGERILLVSLDGKEEVIEADTLQDSIGALARWLHSLPRRRRLRVWLSGSLCRPFVLPDTADLTRRDRENLTQRLASDAGGLAAATSAVFDVRIDALIGVAVNSLHLEGLRAVTGGHRIEIRPWWAGVANWLISQDKALESIAVFDTDALTVLSGRGSAIEFAETITPVVHLDSAKAAWERALIEHGHHLSERAFVRLKINDNGCANEVALGANAETPAFYRFIEVSR